jgi:predicted Zn finger-like uncharacterized protein
MSLITRCPACATQFKVVPDQLKLSDGWVRCGHCSDVFDATRYLENWADGSDTAASVEEQPLPRWRGKAPVAQQGLDAQRASIDSVVPAQPTPADSAFPADTDAGPAPLGADEFDMDLSHDEPDLPVNGRSSQLSGVGSESSSSLGQAIAQSDDRSAEAAADFHTELQQFAATLGKPVGALEDAPDVAAPLAPRPLPSAKPPAMLAAPAAVIVSPAKSEAPVDAALEPGFMRQARRRAFWHAPGTRALLALLALALSALLAAQWALHGRDRLAALYPDWQPLLVNLCEPLGCRIEPVRDLQAVVIDSSTLTRRIGDFYSFDLVLKNNAAIPLAVPALELSLTDTADTVISRRVFLPEELPGVPLLLPPSSAVSVSLRLSLAADGGQPMAGYRALVFYP